MKSYHFDLGNSTDGPIGYCASVRANSKEEAVKILREALPEDLAVCEEYNFREDGTGIGYIRVYFNWETQPNVADIDDWESVKGDD